VLAGEQVKAPPIEAFASTLERIEAPLAIVVGGGAAARTYISAARELGLDESGLDELGIQLTRANARLLVAAFGDQAYPKPAEDFDEAATALRSYDRVCMGGTHPGHTTDAVAAMTAERLGAQRLVVVTNVDGVYTSDPKRDPDADRLDEISFSDLVGITGAGREAGHSAVVDPLAAQIIQRSGIETRVVDGDDQANVASAVDGVAFEGTTVVEAA
jgi:uridylate kinase